MWKGFNLSAKHFKHRERERGAALNFPRVPIAPTPFEIQINKNNKH